MPVYEMDGGSGYEQIGSVYLLFDVNNLQEIVDGALLNEYSAVGILDKSGMLVVGSGTWYEEYAAYEESMEDANNLIQVGAVGSPGWRMMSVTPKSSLLSGITQMQWINYATWLVMLAALLLICAIIYVRIIQPISRQTAFMANFTKDTGQRIEVTEKRRWRRWRSCGRI